MDGIAGTTVARQIAAHCVAREGFVPGVPPEAAELTSACDFVLFRLHLSQLHILCLVDGETSPGRVFGMLPARAEAIAKACLKYSGSVSMTKMPVVIEIVEIATAPPSEQDRARLRHFRRSSIFSKGVLFAEHVDATTRQVWRNRWGVRLMRTTPERALRAAPATEAEIQATLAERALPVVFHRPLVTWLLLAVLGAIFLLEMLASHDSKPSIVTLISLGGINRKLVLAGEWWRAASATVLHADFNHLLANGFSLVIAGTTLEAIVGRAWFGAIYVLSALVGSVLSIQYGTFLVSVGASGAIMGVVAAAVLCGLVRRRREFGLEAFRLGISVLIPTLGLALWGGAGAAHIDHFAHFGGAVGGTLSAGVLLVAWKKDNAQPPGRALALAVVALGCAALAFAAVEVSRHRKSDDVRFVPDATLPRDGTERGNRLAQLVSQYPDDPRTHFSVGLQHWRGSRFADAESAFRQALGLDRTLLLYFKPELTLQIRAGLAGVLKAQHKDAEAREVAKPLCDQPPDAPLVDDWLKRMRQSLCR
jgi:rhomboid protease GluP